MFVSMYSDTCCTDTKIATAKCSHHHSILLNKLKYYGLKGSTLNIFQSYLSNKKQIEDTTSTILPIQVGVPQGSILGPILFM